MRIALLTHKVDFQDGQGRVNYEIVRAALDRGDEVTVVAEFCSDDIAQHPRGRFMRMRDRPVPTQLLRNLYFARKSARWLRKHRHEFDVIQANGFVTWEPADIVAVHFVHEAWLHNPSFPFRWGSFSLYQWYQRGLTLMNAHYERKAFLSAKQLVAVSRATAEDVARLGVNAGSLRVIYNGVDTSEFHPAMGEEPSERSTFELPEGVPLALFVGDIRTPRKNLGVVLRALQMVPGLHVAVAGATEGSPYPDEAQELGLRDRVHFLGKISRIPALMRSCDLFVIPSRYESFGMVVLEALASGLPVILSSKVGAVELVSDVCRVLDNPDDSGGLAAMMTDLLASPEERDRLAKAGRERAMQVSWSRTAAAYLNVYDEFLAGQESGPKGTP